MLACAPVTNRQLNLPQGAEQKSNEETEKTEMLRRNGSFTKFVESVLRLEGSLWWERFVKKVGLELAVKERGSYGW